MAVYGYCDAGCKREVWSKDEWPETGSDTGWQEMTTTENDYNKNINLQCKKIGKVLYIRGKVVGSITGTNSSQSVKFSYPEGFDVDVGAYSPLEKIIAVGSTYETKLQVFSESVLVKMKVSSATETTAYTNTKINESFALE